MTPERHRQVGEIYHAALAVAPEERTAFLEKASGSDAELLREVQSLLTAHALRGKFHRRARAGSGNISFGQTTGSAVSGSASRTTKCSRSSARAAWARSTARATRSSGAMSRSRSCRASFTTDPERRARFEREARLLASLNHPHIGAIYGVEDMDGTPALVLELVEGDTLAERIARGPIPLGEALNIARQIADALEAAHEKGIIHRDLKPANIKITADGVVKVLDFGLAKAVERRRDRPRSVTVADDHGRPARATGVDPRHGRLHEPGAGAREAGRQADGSSGRSAACSTRC